MAELPNPASASFLAVIVPVIMAMDKPVSAMDGVGSGWRMSPRMVPTKIAAMCIPRGSTPGGTGINQIAKVTMTMAATFSARMVRSCGAPVV